MVIGDPAEWPVEVKLLRLLGDNGKLNDNMFMHVFSSYPAHRSALTNVAKLRSFGCFTRRALIYGFDYEDWSMEPAVQACETLALAQVSFLDRVVVPFDPLAHPVHKSGKVYTRRSEGWPLPVGSRTPTVLAASQDYPPLRLGGSGVPSVCHLDGHERSLRVTTEGSGSTRIPAMSCPNAVPAGGGDGT